MTTATTDLLMPISLATTTTTPDFFVPLPLAIPFWPSELAQLPDDSVLNDVGIGGFEIIETVTQTTLRLTIVFRRELAISLPGLEAMSIVFGGSEDGSGSSITAEVDVRDPFAVRLVDVSVALRMQQNALRPVKRDENGKWIVDTKADGTPKPFEIELVGVTLGVDSDGNVSVTFPGGAPALEIEAFMVAETGIVVEPDQPITLHLSKLTPPPPGQQPGWMGVYIPHAAIHLPDVDFPAVPSGLEFTDCAIGSGGFSGTVDVNWARGEVQAKLGGAALMLSRLRMVIVQSIPTVASMSGELTLPFFDKPIGVDLAISLNGEITATFSAVQPPDAKVVGGLVTLTKPNLLELTVESIWLRLNAGLLTVGLSGQMKPLVAGANWPAFAVKELSIDSHGDVHLDGGWLNLREKYLMNFRGFQLEISKLGFGKTEDGGKWMGFSGAVKLLAAMPAGASVEGLRLTWYDDGRIQTSLNGVGVNFEVPNTLKFNGEVSYDSAANQFLGAVKLDLIALKMQVDATAVFRMHEGQICLAVYLAAEFPAGIPLFATGLGVYGMAGLFALNMEPNRAATEPWYAMQPASDYYHRAPAGVTSLQKWTAKPGSMAFGAGVTLGTVADNGHTFSGKMLLAIVFPGPILLIQGSASILQERTKLDTDANFRALAVLDGRAGTFQIGLDALYRYDNNGSLIDIHGGAEGYFNFNDPNAWRLNVGLREPRDRRLAARLFKLFDSYSYVALDAQQLAMGAWIGFKQQWQFGPLSVALEAWIDGNARVSWKPAHFYGDLALHGSAKLSVFGFGVGLTVDANIAADVFDPLHVRGQFNVAIDLPWPLSDIAVNVKLEWGPQPTRPPLPLPLKEVAIEHFKASTSWPLPRAAGTPLLLPNYDSNNDGFLEPRSGSDGPPNLNAIPVVPLDSRPHVTFARNVHDDALVGVNAQPVIPEFERIGDPVRNQGPARIRYGLEEIALEKFNQTDNQWRTAARKGRTANAAGVPTLFGSWAPVPQMPGGGGRNVGQTKLWLWSKTPFEYTRRTGRSWDEWFTDEYSGYPCQTVASPGWDFEEIEPGPLPDLWKHPDEPGLTIHSGDPSVVALSRPSHGLTHALSMFGGGQFEFERPTNLVRLMITDSRLVRVQDFVSRGDEVSGGSPGGTPDRPYIEFSGGHINRIDYSPEGVTGFQLATGVQGAIGGAYIPSLHQFVFVEFVTGNLSAIDLLTEKYSVLGTGYTEPEDVVVTADGKVAYVTEREGTLWRVDLTAKADRDNATLVTKGMTAPSQIALDEEGGKAYVVEYVEEGISGRLLRIDLDGPTAGNQTVLATRLDQAVGLLVTSDLSTAYVSEQGRGGRLIRINLSDGTRGVVAQNIPAIFFLRWANSAQDAILTVQRDPINFVIRIDLNKPEPVRIMDNLPFRPSSITILPDDRYVVCSDEELTLFTTTLLVPKICDIHGNILVRHFEEEFARWSQAGDVLQPYSKYRLKIVTTVTARGEGQLRGYSSGPQPPITEYAYFRTDGPPGVAKLTEPIGASASAPGAYVSPLDDLSRYVRKTMPRLVEAPATPRPFYRAYDVGIEFDENYVDLMYRLGRRDLSMHLYDTNGAIRDGEGRRLVLANQWGRAEDVTLTDREERWRSVLGESGCSLINLGTVVKNNTFNVPHEPHVLSPSALCEARLIPALLHDAFQGYSTNAGADGPNGSFERWQVRDDSGSAASRWRINAEGTPPDFELRQTVAAASTALVYKNTSDLPADSPEQPSKWSDYRLTVHLRHKEGRIGVVFRYGDAGQHYRYVMDQAGTRKLIRVANGVSTVLATKNFAYVADQQYVVSVEAVKSSLRVYQDGLLVFAVTDSAINAGSIGLYCAGNSNARFTDVYVDDFSNSAAVVYSYSFLTSRFRNFVDHLNSFEKKTWLSDLAPGANVAPLIAAAVNPTAPVSDAESRAYDALAAQLPRVAAAPVVRVTRVQQNGSAIALLVQSPEPLDWSRMDLHVLSAPAGAVTAKVLRKNDGAGLFIVVPAATPPGSSLPQSEYRLVFTYRRNNTTIDSKSDVFSEAGNSAPEQATLDVPWQTQ